jgi:PAS domain S-box-containing protein
VLDATGSIVMVVDVSNGHVVGMNEPTRLLTGFAPEELLDRPLWETIMATQDRAAMRATYRATVEGGVPLAYESTIATRSGERRRVVWSGEFLRDGNGAPTHLVVSGIDVTATRSSAGLFGHLMRAATTTAFVGTDRAGVVTYFSSGAESMLGYPAIEMLGHPFPTSCFEGAQLQHRAEELGMPVGLGLLAVAGERGEPGDDWTMVRRDGTQLTVSLTVDPVTDVSGRLVGHLGVGHDVTEQRATEQLLVRTLATEHDALEKLRRLDQERTTFVATVSHELRTPMASITGYTELLRDVSIGELNSGQAGFLDAISRNTERLSSLANDLLALSSLEAATFRHEPVDVDLRDVVAAVQAELRPAIDAGDLEVVFIVPAEPVTVQGDAANLERMLVNLVGNAIKFTEHSGWVRCTLGQLEGNARLAVADNGIGIPQAEQNDLFTRFFRSSNALEHSIQGSGLGLTIVESIVISHGGDISVVSADGQGTTFTVTMPLKGPQRPSDAGQAEPNRSESA